MNRISSIKKYASLLIIALLLAGMEEDIDHHKKTGNWRALVEKLSDHQQELRQASDGISMVGCGYEREDGAQIRGA